MAEPQYAGMTDRECLDALRALISGVPHPVSNLSNAASLLYLHTDRLNWLGFYLTEGETLVLGPFQGKPACIEIPFGKGVCGTAAGENRTVRVEDVHLFPGHIACDGASASELVIPIRKDGKVFGVLDIDSPEKGRFGDAEEAFFTAAAKILEKEL